MMCGQVEVSKLGMEGLAGLRGGGLEGFLGRANVFRGLHQGLMGQGGAQSGRGNQGGKNNTVLRLW